MPAEKDLNAQLSLQNDLRQAVIENDPERIGALIDGAALDDNFRFELIGGVIATGDYPALVARLLSGAGDDVTPTAYVSYLSSAARQGHAQTAALMAEKCIAAGISVAECDDMAVKNTPPQKIAAVAQALVAGDAEAETRLANMMLDATTAKNFDTLSALLATGADMRGHGSIILLMLLESRGDILGEEGDKPRYLGLVGQVIDGCRDHKDLKTLDLVMTLVAYRLPEGKEYPELMERLAEAGADPFAMKEEARRFLVKEYLEKDDTARADKWADWFDTHKDSYTARHAQMFDTLFGHDFRFQDLKQTVDENGESGLHLAAKARRIPAVMKTLIAGGDLTIDDIFAANKRGESMLSLAIDRGDAPALLSPVYWGRRDVDVMAALEEKLSDDRKKWIDMGTIAAQVDHHRLQKMGEDYQPQFRLRPRAG